MTLIRYTRNLSEEHYQDSKKIGAWIKLLQSSNTIEAVVLLLMRISIIVPPERNTP